MPRAGEMADGRAEVSITSARVRKTSNAQNRAPAILEMRDVPAPKGRAAVASPFGDLTAARHDRVDDAPRCFRSRPARRWREGRLTPIATVFAEED